MVPVSETAAGSPVTMQNVTMADFSLSKYSTVHCGSVQVCAANASPFSLSLQGREHGSAPGLPEQSLPEHARPPAGRLPR